MDFKNWLIFRKYKTSKTELKKNGSSEIVIDIKPELFDVINLYITFHPLLDGKIKIGRAHV